jgi:hypothetical protein
VIATSSSNKTNADKTSSISTEDTSEPPDPPRRGWWQRVVS